jgi:hypothetical protein
MVDGEIRWGKGGIFGTVAKLAHAWKVFAEKKFKTTAREDERDAMPDLGVASTRSGSELTTLRELEQGLKTLKLVKAPSLLNTTRF